MVILITCPADSAKGKCINACLAPIASLDGCSVVTVEGLGNCVKGFNPVQGKASSHRAELVPSSSSDHCC